MSASGYNEKLFFHIYDELRTHIGDRQAGWAVGQGAHESRGYNSRLALEAMNFWGIKSTPNWRGAVWRGKTVEFTKGTAHRITDGFRAYPSIRAGVEDYLSLVKRLYSDALAQPNQLVFLDKLQGRWATDPNYAPNVLRSINKAQSLINARNQLKMPLPGTDKPLA